jgi:hypothetical protein
MHGPINVKSPNNTSKWQMGFNSAFKGLRDGCTNGRYEIVRRVENIMECLRLAVKIILKLILNK